MKIRLKDKQGGALLFAIITSFVLSLVAAALISLTSNQYKIVDNEIKRKEAYYWQKAGMEYANWWIRNELAHGRTIALPRDLTFPDTLPSHFRNFTITITSVSDLAILSDYQINVYTEYAAD